MLKEAFVQNSSAAAEFALTSKDGKSFDKESGIDGRGENEVDGRATSKRSGAKRGRNRRRKKREGKSGCKEDKDESDQAATERIPCGVISFRFENCKEMMTKPGSSPCATTKGKENIPKKRERRNVERSNRKPKAASINDAIVKIEQIALEVKQTEKRKLRLMKKSDLIRKGQSGWAGACFDRSPSPSLLPMPPSILLEMASRSNFCPSLETWDFGEFAD
ncbi:hypothetical protein BSKO_12917 [Bryopsis sp. KO-2023]|nr:hypothetical protein BSKO_12917 [Bryopsis sp. KO-2023]